MLRIKGFLQVFDVGDLLMTHPVRLSDESWAGLHYLRAVLLAKIKRNVNLDRVIQFLLTVYREARQKDPQIVESAFRRVFTAENTAKVAVR